ncbi:MAG: AtpZ/AtpI family protein [Erysipelotrichaceae bacterium]|nr:AtpZ/AtpI family protein [Erysipelotrichaceae bacterium]MDP3305312.1 AtpZ/AtpI family protein [Erysipelotrichaceae bacterium]
MKKALAVALQLGFAIGGMITLATLLGLWLDGVFNTTPWLTIIGCLMGVASAFKYLIDWTRDN